jgi:cysteine synthase
MDAPYRVFWGSYPYGQKLAEELWLGVGISSGANFLAALKVRKLLGGDGLSGRQ